MNSRGHPRESGAHARATTWGRGPRRWGPCLGVALAAVALLASCAGHAPEDPSRKASPSEPELRAAPVTIPSSSFEEGDFSGDVFAGAFQLWNDPSTKAHYSVVSDLAQDGRRSIAVAIREVSRTDPDDTRPGATTFFTPTFDAGRMPLPCDTVHRFSAYVSTAQSAVGPRAYVDWQLPGAGRTLLEGTRALPRTPGWQMVTRVFRTPPCPSGADSVGVRLFVGSEPLPSHTGSTYFIDTFALEGLPMSNFVLVQSKDDAQVSPDAALQVNLAVSRLDLEHDTPATLQVDLPGGVKLVSTTQHGGDFVGQDTLRDGHRYTRITLDYATLTRPEWFLFEQLYLATTWPVGRSAPMFVVASWKEGPQTFSSDEIRVRLESIALPAAPRIERLGLGLMDWARHEQIQTWPDYHRLLVHSGATTFGVGMDATYAPSKLAEVEAQLRRARALGLETTISLNPFAQRRIEPSDEGLYKEHELARARDQALLGYWCPGQPLGTEAEPTGFILDRRLIAVAGKADIDWIHFDWEPRQNTSFCAGALAAFTREYGYDATSRGCRVSEWDGAVMNGYDPCGLAFRDFQRSAGTQMWRSVFEKLSEARPERPLITQWELMPGFTHEGYSDFDELFPRVFLAASPAIYPQWPVRGHPGRTGPNVRRSLLGLLALTGRNLAQNGGAEEGSGAWPDRFSTSQSTAGLGWDEISQTRIGRAAEGRRSLRIDLAAARAAGAPGGETPRFFYELGGVSPSEDYIFAVSASRPTNEPAWACIEVTWLDANRAPLGAPARDCGTALGVGSGWQRLAVLGRAPATASKARIALLAEEISLDGSSAGARKRVWFDKLIVAQPDLVANPGLERGAGSLPDGFQAWGKRGLVRWESGIGSLGSRAIKVAAGSASDPTTGMQTRVPAIAPQVPYQLSAGLRSVDRNGEAVLEITWLASNGRPLSTHRQRTRLSGTAGFRALTTAATSPRGAASAIVRVGVTGAAMGTALLDDLDLRVDGPYVAPWMTPGWYSWEVESREVGESLLEAFVAGAQRVIGHPSPGWEGADLQSAITAARMLEPIEALIADGRPIPTTDVTSNLPHVRARGMEQDGDSAILVSSYAWTPTAARVTYRTRFPGTLWRIQLDGSRTKVTTLPAGGGDFLVRILPQDPLRVRLFFFERER